LIRAHERSGLHFTGVHCRLGERQVLRGIQSRPVQSGRVLAVVGPNGAGKSTLLRCIAGFAPCTAERLEIDGTDLRLLKPSERAKLLRYLPQAAPAALNLSVQECLQVALHAHATKLSLAEGRKRIDSITAALGLAPLMERDVDELSGGQKQLVWLAQALVHSPRALLLDEPLAALDPNHQHHVMRLLRQLASQRDLVVLVVLHDLNMAARYADEVLVLRDGCLLAQGNMDEALHPDILAQAFQVQARVEHCGQGTPVIIIDDLLNF